MKTIYAALAATSLAAVATPADAANIVIDFDAVTSARFVNGFYNGGTDSAGASGPNLGVDFVTGGWIADVGYGTSAPNFAYTVLGGPSFVNVAAGFVGSIEFTYGAFNGDTVIGVYDGLNGTGALLGSVSAPANNVFAFSPLSLSFAGVGRSIRVVGNGQNFGWDDLRLDTGAVPEPSTWAMLILGFGAVGATLRRRQRQTSRVSFA